MRHLNKRHRLGRPQAHRKATLKALSTALIKHKRIRTTVSKAKALRVYVEPIINRAKEDTTQNRRQAFRYLQDKEAVKSLFGEIGDAIADRNGGYTRIVKLGARPGDAAEMAVIELVDFGDVGADTGRGAKKRRTRRGATRRGAGATTAAPTKAAKAATPATPAPPAEAPAPTEAPVEEAPAPENVEEAPAPEASANDEEKA